MRRLVIVVGCVIASLAIGTVGAVIASDRPDVQATPFGQRYHRDGCPYTRRGSATLSISDAQALKRGPCKYCQPGK